MKGKVRAVQYVILIGVYINTLCDSMARLYVLVDYDIIAIKDQDDDRWILQVAIGHGARNWRLGPVPPEDFWEETSPLAIFPHPERKGGGGGTPVRDQSSTMERGGGATKWKNRRSETFCTLLKTG